MTSRLIAVALDCRDVEKMSAFWCAALGSTIVTRWRDARGKECVELGLGEGVQDAVLLLQPVDQEKVTKNRLHLDVAPTNTTQTNEIARLVALGGDPITLAPSRRCLTRNSPRCSARSADLARGISRGEPVAKPGAVRSQEWVQRCAERPGVTVVGDLDDVLEVNVLTIVSATIARFTYRHWSGIATVLLSTAFLTLWRKSGTQSERYRRNPPGGNIVT